MEAELIAVSAVGMSGADSADDDPEGVAGVLFSSAGAGSGVGEPAEAADSEDVAGAVVSSVGTTSEEGSIRAVVNTVVVGNAKVVEMIASMRLEVLGSGVGIAALRVEGGTSLSGLGIAALRVDAGSSLSGLGIAAMRVDSRSTGESLELGMAAGKVLGVLGGAVLSGIAALRVDGVCVG